MIKLFRNIRKNLLAEGKTSRYLKYAIGEIILVVIGILIALQVNNWNEHRKSQTQELNLAKQLLNDAKADSVFFESRIGFQKRRDTLLNTLLKLYKGIAVDSISRLKSKEDPFFFRLAYQSNLINNNPEAYDLISDEAIKSKLRNYNATYDYVVQSIALNNRICEEYGVPLQIKYFNELQLFHKSHLIKNLLFTIDDEETMAKVDLFKFYGTNYFTQIEKFLNTNHELILLLEVYLKTHK